MKDVGPPLGDDVEGLVDDDDDEDGLDEPAAPKEVLALVAAFSTCMWMAAGDAVPVGLRPRRCFRVEDGMSKCVCVCACVREKM